MPDPYAAYPPDEARALAAAAANEVLTEHCGSCHGAEAVESGRVEAAFDNVDRIENLVAGPWMSRCWSEDSALIAVLGGADADAYHRTLSTPPATADAVATVADFIDRDCERLGAICAEDPGIAGCEMVGVETWLGQTCGDCHSRRLLHPIFEEGFLYIDDLPRMVGEGKVVPCRSEESMLIQYMRMGEIQPDGPHDLPAADVVRIASFIDNMGLCPGAERDPERDEVEAMLRRSCGECHGGQPGDVTRADGGLAQIDNLSALADAGVVSPCLGSGIVDSIIDGSMPPPGSTAPVPSLEEVDRLLSVLERPCLLPGGNTEGDAWRLIERRRLAVLAAPPPVEMEMRPDVPPVENECFEYLGDWIRCEYSGTGDPALEMRVPGTIEDCMQACLERADCTAVADWSWLDVDDLGCTLHLAPCQEPGSDVWHEEDGAREYRKTCSP